MTSLPACPQYKGRRENTSCSSSSSLTVLFEACNSGKITVFLLLSWRALARRLGSVWIRVLVIWQPMTHTTLASFVWAWSTHAMSLRGRFACIVSGSLWGSSALIYPSFREKRVSCLLPTIQDPPLPRHGGEWNRGVRKWIWPMVTYEHAAPFWASEFPHSEEWVPRSPELLIGRASTAPLTIEGHLWARRSPEFPLIMKDEFSAPQSSLSVELALSPPPRGSPMSMPLPSEHLSFPLLLRVEFSAPQGSVIGRSPCWSS